MQHRHDVEEPGRLQLVIDNLSPDDAAMFVCRASNVAGDSEATAAVTVNCMFHRWLLLKV